MKKQEAQDAVSQLKEEMCVFNEPHNHGEFETQ